MTLIYVPENIHIFLGEISMEFLLGNFKYHIKVEENMYGLKVLLGENLEVDSVPNYKSNSSEKPGNR